MTVSEEMEENLGDGPKKRSDSGDSRDSRDKNSRREKSKHLSKVSKFFASPFLQLFNIKINNLLKGYHSSLASNNDRRNIFQTNQSNCRS